MSRCAAVSHVSELSCFQDRGHEGETCHAWLNEAGEIARAWVDDNRHLAALQWQFRFPAGFPIAKAEDP